MNQLPPELYRIVYKYVYDSVLSHFISWYGTVNLKCVSQSELCDTIKKDMKFIIDNETIDNETYTNRWVFNCSIINGPSNATKSYWSSDLASIVIYNYLYNTNAS